MIFIFFICLTANFFQLHFLSFQTHANLNTVLEYMLSFLDKEAVDNVKNSTQYFLVIKCYIQMVIEPLASYQTVIKMFL